MTTEIGSLAVSLSMDASNFNGSINQMNRHLTAMGSELRAAKALGADYGKSIDGLTSKKEILTRTVATSSVKLTEERRKYDELVASGTANEATLERQARRVNEAQAQYNRLTTELNEVTEELRIQSSAWTQAGARMEAVGGKMKAIGDGMTSVGKKMSMAITAPIVAAGTASVKMAADFEAQMDRVGAIAGATAGEMDALNESALKLGADTSKSASEVAVAMEDMAAMGFNAVEIIGAMPGVISASEASGESLALAAQTVAAALNVWGLGASEASRVADVLAMAANQSAAGIGDMQLAFKYAGAPAAALGIQLEEVAAAIGIMTDSGLDGSNAGTALRASLLALNNPAKAQEKIMKKLGFSILDADGNAKSLSEMVGDLGKSLEGETEAQKVATVAKLVGTEAVSGFLALIKAGPANIDKMTTALENSGGASAETAAKMKDNLKGALEELGGTIETAAITIGNKLIPSLRDGAKTIQGLVEKFSDLSPEAQKNILVMAGVAAAIGPVLVVGGTLISSIGSIITAAGTMSTAIGAAGSAFTVLAGPIGWTVAGIALLATGIGAATLAYKESNDINLEVLDAKQKEIDANDKLIASFDALQYKNQLSNSEMLRFLDINAELEMTNSPDKVAALKNEQAKLLEKSSLTNDEMDEFLGLNQKVIDGAPETVKSISLQGEAYANNTLALKELNAEKAKELQNAAYETLTKAIDKENSLLKEQKQLVSEVNQKNELQKETKKQIGTLSTEIWKSESEILKLEQQKNGASAEEIINLDSKIRREKEVLEEKNLQKSRAEEMIITYGKQLGERDKLLETNRKELAALEEAKFKYEEIILAQVGITAEKGRSGVQLSEELTMLELQKTKLSELLKSGKINTAEYQEQNTKIDSQIGKLQTAKSELQLINDVAGKTVFKDVVLSENPKNFWDTLDENLRRPITKNVNIRYNGSNGPQEPGYAKGTSFHPGGRFIAGEEGFELGRMGNKWEMLNLGMYNRPAGFEVFTHKESKKIISSLNGTPGYATGASAIGAADSVINSLNRPIELKIVSELSGVITASKNVGKELMNEVGSVLINATRKINDEVTKIAADAEKERTAIQKDSVAKIEEIERKSAQTVETILKTSVNKKGALTASGSQRLLNDKRDTAAKITKIEQDEQTKLAKVNEKAWNDIQKKEQEISNERLSSVKKFISDKKAAEEISLADEAEIWKTSVKYFKDGTEEKRIAQLALRDAQRAVDKEMLDSGIAYIDEKKRLGQISLQDEIRLLDELSTHFAEHSTKFETIQKRKAQVVKQVNDDVTRINESFSAKMVDINQKMSGGILKVNEELASKTKSINDRLSADTLKAKEELATKSQAINDRLISDQQRLTDELAKAVDDQYKKLFNSTGLFEKFDMSPKQSGEALSGNLKSQLDGLKSWEEEIGKLSSKAIDDGLLAELKEMGPKALPQLLALNSMTEEQLSNYSNMYQEKSSKARQLAEAQMAGMKEDTQRRLEELRSVANAELEQLKTDTYIRINEMRLVADSELAQLRNDANIRITEMRVSANEQLAVLKTEWVAEINNITKATDEEFKSLTEVGKNAGQNLLDGLASMESSLVDKARNIALAVNAALQSALGGSASVDVTGVGASGTSYTPTSKNYTASSTINIYAPTASPSEIARKNQQLQRDMAMAWT